MALDGDSKAMNRPEGGFRFKRGGLKCNTPADAMQPNQYPFLKNVRLYDSGIVRTRPGYEIYITTAASPVSSIRALTQSGLGYQPLPYTVLQSGAVYFGNQLGGNIGANEGASMIPFRPAASPLPWMYIATSTEYNKYGTPNFINVVEEQLAGIE